MKAFLIDRLKAVFISLLLPAFLCFIFLIGYVFNFPSIMFAVAVTSFLFLPIWFLMNTLPCLIFGMEGFDMMNQV